MQITLLHPSYGRPEKARQAYNQWEEAARDFGNVQYIIALDKRDRSLTKYQELFDGLTVCVANSDCVVKATNEAAKLATGEVFVYMSDDFVAPDGWDNQLRDAITKRNLQGTKYLLQVDDTYQAGTVVLTIPIMSKALFDHLGYFWHPGYRSMFVDNDLYYTCKHLGVMVDLRSEIVFEHQHFSNGKAEMDATYKQSQANWHQGRHFFNKRSRQNNWGVRL